MYDRIILVYKNFLDDVKGQSYLEVAVKSHLASQELQLAMLLLLQKCTNV